jgi:putative Ca2+/H+ antiporter (TMEM165/GDT1 family)
VPVVFFGGKMAERIPLAMVRKVTAVAFAILGAYALLA